MVRKRTISSLEKDYLVWKRTKSSLEKDYI